MPCQRTQGQGLSAQPKAMARNVRGQAKAKARHVQGQGHTAETKLKLVTSLTYCRVSQLI